MTTALTGIAAYAAYRAEPVPGRLWLAMANHEWAIRARAKSPGSYGLLRPDEGNDLEEIDFSNPDPAAEANRFAVRYIEPALARVPDGTYNAVLGACELWYNDWRLAFRAKWEDALCTIVQDELGLDYVALSCPVGNLEPDELPLFFEVFRRARWVSYHGYLGLNRNAIEQEIDDWWLYRPTRLWLPVLRQAGIPLRLLCTEIGTGPRPADVGLDKAGLAALDIQIVAALADECERVGAEFGGALPFAFGAEGQMGVDWNLDGYEAMFEQEQEVPMPEWTLGFKDYAATHPEVGTPVEGLQYDDHGNAWQHSDTGLLFWHKAANQIHWFVKAPN